MSAADWLDRATQVLNDARALLTNFGHAPDPTLHIELDLHPCPGYSHEDSSIRFCPPVIESIVDELRWSFFRSLMGCASREETVEFYDCALPLIVCHELAHHLRIRRGVAQDSHFHEEQICDRLAVAMVESMPRHASTLAPLQAHCARMRQRLEHRYEHRHGWAFLPSILEVLDARGALDVNVRASLERLCAQRASMDFDQLLAVLPGISEEELAAARAARARARAQVDADYARDPAEYWHLSLAWLERYLARARRPSLAAVLNAHLPIEPKSNEELLLTVQETLEHDSSLHARVLAASTLLIHYGGAVVHDLLDVVEVEWKRSQAPAHDAACALLRALTNAWPERGHALDDAARRVLSWLSPSTSDERFVAAFELAARARRAAA